MSEHKKQNKSNKKEESTKNEENFNLGGFPNILINNDLFKKKRETAEMMNEGVSIPGNMNILNIANILGKKK